VELARWEMATGFGTVEAGSFPNVEHVLYSPQKVLTASVRLLSIAVLDEKILPGPQQPLGGVGIAARPGVTEVVDLGAQDGFAVGELFGGGRLDSGHYRLLSKGIIIAG